MAENNMFRIHLDRRERKRERKNVKNVRSTQKTRNRVYTHIQFNRVEK